jgi:ABC-type polysaccharide/polyol phosphate export permease
MGFARSKLTGACGYCRRVWHYRHFWLSLVVLDLRAKYRRSVLGVGWTLLHPLAMTTVLCVVFHEMLGLDLFSYIPFVLTGLAVWNFLTSVTLEGCGCLYAGEKYIRAQPIPLAIDPLRTLLSVGVHFLIVLSLSALLALATRGCPNPTALLSLVPGLLLLLAFGWSAAVLFGFANVYFPDTHHIAQIGFQVLFYLTPILYPAEAVKSRLLHFVVEQNPLAALVVLIRAPLLDGTAPSPEVFARAAVVVALVMAGAVFTLHRFERKLIFQL